MTDRATLLDVLNEFRYVRHQYIEHIAGALIDSVTAALKRHPRFADMSSNEIEAYLTDALPYLPRDIDRALQDMMQELTSPLTDDDAA